MQFPVHHTKRAAWSGHSRDRYRARDLRPLSANEGAYGLDGDGLARAPSIGACLPQSLGACP